MAPSPPGWRGGPRDGALPTDPDSAAAAEAAALRILAAAAQSAASLRQRLIGRGFTAAAAAAATEAMATHGYVDDSVLASSVAAEGERRGYGARRLAADLRRRGLDGAAIEQALAAADPATERSRAAQALERELRRRGLEAGALSPGDRGRIGAALQRRGFDSAVIRSVMELSRRT